jgi:hypothetical protein
VETWDDLGMPRSNNDDLPSTYVVPGQSGQWPNAELRADAPISAHFAQAYARDLAVALASREPKLTLRKLAEQAEVSHATLSRLLRGQVLPDMGTLIRIEWALGTDIWPGLKALEGTPVAAPGSSPASTDRTQAGS